MIYLYSLLIGLALGSFANVCIFRLPKNKSIVSPRSFCPSCGKTITAWQNIPVISFILLGRKCFYCRAPISWRYCIVEISMATLFLLHAALVDVPLLQLLYLDVFTFFLLTISIIDFEHLIIPDELSLSLAAIGLVVSFVNPYLSGTPAIKFLHSLLAGLGGCVLMLGLAWMGEKVFKKEALGGGDIKLLLATGTFLGVKGIYGPIMVGSLTGGSAGLLLLWLGKKRMGETLPFGPFLSLGAYFTALYPSLWSSFF